MPKGDSKGSKGKGPARRPTARRPTARHHNPESEGEKGEKGDSDSSEGTNNYDPGEAAEEEEEEEPMDTVDPPPNLTDKKNSSTEVEGSDEDSDYSSDSEVIINSSKKKKGGKTGSKKAKKSESSDSYAPKKKKQLRTKLLDAKLSESDDSDFQVLKKGKGKKRKAKTESSEEQESTEEDSDAPTKRKGRGKRSAVSKQKEKGKKGKHSKRPRIKMASISSDEKMSTEGEEEIKRRKRKKKKKKKGSSSEEDGSDEDEDGEGSPSRGRKKIRKIKSDKKLNNSARKTVKAEQERRKRITEKQKERKENICKHHTDMVSELSEMFSLDSEEWRSICSRVKMMQCLSNKVMGGVKGMFDLCIALKKKGIINYGEYSKLREILVTCDVEAGETIDKFTKIIRGESEGKPQAKRQRTLDKQRQRHSTEFSPKIATMIERTKAMIEEDKKRTFIATKGFQDAKEKLHKNQVVVIKGNTGDGKTTTAIRLILGLIEEQQGRQPLELHNIEDLDSLPTKSKLITFIDDIFGEKVAHEKDVGEWNKRIKSVLPTLCEDKPTEANFLLITIRNEVFNSLRSHSLENVLVGSNIIDLSSDDYKIEKEKLELLELYKPKKDEFSWKEDEKKEIVKHATGIGFPQCCRLFRNIPDLQKERVNFFKRPFYFLSTALEKLKECNALLFLFLNDGEILVKDLDPNGEKVNETLLKEAFDIDLKGVGGKKSAWSVQEKIEFVCKSLDNLSGFLVVKQKYWYGDGFVYRFAHDSIHATVALLYGEKTPIGYIKYCPTKSLSLLTISKSSPDRIMISPDNYVYMFERIHRELESHWYDYYENVGSLDVWTDGQFIERFVRWLNDKNIDKVDVLNKASRFGVKLFALYLLSQGVKPDKDTDWFSLVTSDGIDECMDPHTDS